MEVESILKKRTKGYLLLIVMVKLQMNVYRKERILLILLLEKELHLLTMQGTSNIDLVDR
jgi:hypothetical protein